MTILIQKSVHTIAEATEQNNGTHTEQTITTDRKGALAQAPIMDGPVPANGDIRWLPIEVTVSDVYHRQSADGTEEAYQLAERRILLSGPPVRKDGTPMMKRGPVKVEWRLYQYDAEPARIPEQIPAWLMEAICAPAFAGPVPTVAMAPWNGA